MKMSRYMKTMIIIIGVVLIPAMIYAQPPQGTTKNPPIQQPLVREGDFAVQLVAALNLGTTSDEAEAESILGSVGIAPHNGWIADYPVTPDIIGELRTSLSDAAASNQIKMGQDEALKAFDNVETGRGLAARPSSDSETHEINSSSNYPETSVINNYYYSEGPPIVTYYAPPPDYYYLYAWVPYPFWWFDFWFPGFFILNDFHRSFHFHGRVAFISNHFNDFRHHRVFRIDPVDRFRGRTFAGIGAPRRGHFISPGVRDSSRSIFNRNRMSPPSGSRSFRSPSSGRSFNQPSGGRSFRSHSGGRSGSSGGGQRR